MELSPYGAYLQSADFCAPTRRPTGVKLSKAMREVPEVGSFRLGIDHYVCILHDAGRAVSEPLWIPSTHLEIQLTLMHTNFTCTCTCHSQL